MEQEVYIDYMGRDGLELLSLHFECYLERKCESLEPTQPEILEEDMKQG